MQYKKIEIEILSFQILKEVPSASGIVKFKNDFFVIGDDSPYLFSIDKDFNFISKQLIYSAKTLLENRIPKIEKPDFEAMEMISENEILVFGSGSKSPERDVCIWIKLGVELSHKEYNITPFFNYLRSLEIMQGYELDIEGLAQHGELLYLLNRGRNVVFTISLQKFLAYCQTGADFPNPQTKLFSLPKIKGLESGFSGATVFGDKPYLIFTASVEDSPNAYDDGDILGSFIGVIEINKEGIGDDFLIQKVDYEKNPLKVESIVIDKVKSKKELDLVLVTDNDGETSEILKVRMTLE